MEKLLINKLMEKTVTKKNGQHTIVETIEERGIKTKTYVKLEVLKSLLKSNMVHTETRAGWIEDTCEKLFNWVWR